MSATPKAIAIAKRCFDAVEIAFDRSERLRLGKWLHPQEREQQIIDATAPIIAEALNAHDALVEALRRLMNVEHFYDCNLGKRGLPVDDEICSFACKRVRAALQLAKESTTR